MEVNGLIFLDISSEKEGVPVGAFTDISIRYFSIVMCRFGVHKMEGGIQPGILFVQARNGLEV